ncbi:MAG: alpha-amylase family glycosyl hydrolase [Bacilli bacterium]|nr:alpha-amylase family glycosyl hydrolase [Bacilli bacterium]
MKSKIKFLLLSLVAFSLCACEGKEFVPISNAEDPCKVTQVVVNPSQLNMKVGDTTDISAIVKWDEEDLTPELTWSIGGSQTVISVTPNEDDQFKARVRALDIGSATVAVKAGNKFSLCYVNVTKSGSGNVPVSSVSLSPSEKTVRLMGDEPQTFTITTTINPSNASDRKVTYQSSNSAVASVEGNGLTANVTVYGEGTTTISATVGGKTGYCYLTASKSSVTDPLEVTLNNSSLNLKEGQTSQLNAQTNKIGATLVWESNNQSVATVDSNGLVTACGVGNAVISVIATLNEESDTATCNVVVTKESGGSDYEEEIAAWSKPGHLYLHYLRNDGDYSPWAVWMWQFKPKHLEGSLWGATQCPASITPMSTSWMSFSDVGKTGVGTYTDAHGQICDIDLTNPNIIEGRDKTPSPIIDDWDNLDKGRIGFLIVNQTLMGGGSHWKSDGGTEAYIKKLDQLFPNGRDSYLHVYCVSGSVLDFTTSTGGSVKPNPTIKDTTGQYRSQNDIQNLKADDFKKGVPTSESFLADEPGTGYQIFVSSFADSNGDGTGDIRGIINKLDYLDDLGVKVLWLTPIQECSSYHGYDVTDYYKIGEDFGTLEDYQELMYKAHKKGMKVLMDLVINHTSLSNVIFQKSQRAEVEVINGKEIHYRDMYLWKFKGDMVRQWDGNGGKDLEPNTEAVYENVPVEEATDWYQYGESNYYYYGKFGSGMAELNYSCQATRDYMADVCKYWLSFGLDGFRLDAIKHIYLLSELDPTTAATYKNDTITYDATWRRHVWDEQMQEYVDLKNDYSYDCDLNVIFWKQFCGTVKSAYPNAYFVGENFDGWNKRIAPFYQSMDSQFDFSTYFHLNEVSEAGIGSDIQATLNYNHAERPNQINGAFTSNHDLARMLNHAAGSATSQSEEIIPDGKSGSNAEAARKRARYFATVTMLTPGVSWIYYGDELGMSGNTQDKVIDSSGRLVDDHGNNVDRWYRQPMKWGNVQGQDQVPLYIVVSGIELRWDLYNQTVKSAPEQIADSGSFYNLFKELCRIKNLAEYPTYGYINWGGSIGGANNTAAFEIQDSSHTVRVLVNNSAFAVSVPGEQKGSGILGGSAGASMDSIPAYGFVVIKG